MLRKWMVLSAVISVLFAQLAFAQDTTTPPPDGTQVRELANQVDVLKIVSDLELTDKQIAYVAAKITDLKKKQEDFKKQEEAALLKIQKPLQQMRDALAAGNAAPESAKSVADLTLKDLQDIRQQAWKEFQAAAIACTQQLDEGQTRKIARSPKAVSRASQMVQQIRSASEQDWPNVQAQFATELLEVKKIDKQSEWKAEEDKLQDLKGEDLDKAQKDLQKQKDTWVTDSRAEINQTLASIRTANSAILSIGVNKLASALRSQTEVRAQLYVMFGQILDNPTAESALKLRMEKTKSTEKPAPVTP